MNPKRNESSIITTTIDRDCTDAKKMSIALRAMQRTLTFGAGRTSYDHLSGSGRVAGPHTKHYVLDHIPRKRLGPLLIDFPI